RGAERLGGWGRRPCRPWGRSDAGAESSTSSESSESRQCGRKGIQVNHHRVIYVLVTEADGTEKLGIHGVGLCMLQISRSKQRPPMFSTHGKRIERSGEAARDEGYHGGEGGDAGHEGGG
uniref:Uncharacterized protein n=1 Tax=Triticum urartu TaxID=4572 RepID=A0A8R7UK37_TRIUA